MKIKVELSNEDVEIIKEQQLFRMQWIQAGMNEREPFDFVVQKILNACVEQMEEEEKK